MSAPCALIVGLCSHGLAIARSLNAAGIKVHAFEANPDIPGFKTRTANVHKVSSIKEEGLVEDLLKFAKTEAAQNGVVLFPTNDKNVEVIAKNVEQLAPNFRISWGRCSSAIRASGHTSPRSATHSESTRFEESDVALILMPNGLLAA